MISFRYPIDINMSMSCLTSPRYLQDTFKIYQIIYLKDICDLYLEDILKIYGFEISVFLHIITGNVHPARPEKREIGQPNAKFGKKTDSVSSSATSGW